MQRLVVVLLFSSSAGWSARHLTARWRAQVIGTINDNIVNEAFAADDQHVATTFHDIINIENW